MAVSQMSKVMIVSHRSEAAKLLEALQNDGICQILNAEEAMVSKDWPELETATVKLKETQSLLNQLTKCVAFLKDYAEVPKGFAAALSPRTVVEEKSYNEIVSDKANLKIAEQCQNCDSTIEKLKTERENIEGTLEHLTPWASLKTPVEELGQLEKTVCLAGLLPTQKIKQIEEQVGEVGAAMQQTGITYNRCACLVVCLKEQLNDIQKLLRSADFDAVSFEPMTGTVTELITQYNQQLNDLTTQLREQEDTAVQLSKNLLKLQILHDHYSNLLNRERTEGSSPATEQTVIFEGWIKKKKYARLEKTVSHFGASSLSEIEPAEGEETPVEIDNNKIVKPFEVITRLYGMPRHFEVDPTGFLAPFFALFFGLCLTDAGYGLIMIAGAIYFIKKTQGDKKFGYLFLICSIFTVICGAFTGGWFGDAVQLINIPWLNKFRDLFLRYGFDPSLNPMTFFAVSLTIGYFQLMFGITVAFFAKLARKDIIAAVCDHLTWLVMLNLLALYGFSRSGTFISPEQGQIFLKIAAVPAATILLFSHRQGNIVARLGMGFYNLASTIFYIGDILSYVRLMALGMVTAGFAMAINQMAVMTSGLKVIGPILAVLVLVGGHLFNLGISALGSFVHSLRLQYVEFFPKFFEGGGKLFEPFSRQYKYVYINKEENKN